MAPIDKTIPSAVPNLVLKDASAPAGVAAAAGDKEVEAGAAGEASVSWPRDETPPKEAATPSRPEPPADQNAPSRDERHESGVGSLTRGRRGARPPSSLPLQKHSRAARATETESAQGDPYTRLPPEPGGDVAAVVEQDIRVVGAKDERGDLPQNESGIDIKVDAEAASPDNEDHERDPVFQVTCLPAKRPQPPQGKADGSGSGDSNKVCSRKQPVSQRQKHTTIPA